MNRCRRLIVVPEGGVCTRRTRKRSELRNKKISLTTPTGGDLPPAKLKIRKRLVKKKESRRDGEENARDHLFWVASLLRGKPGKKKEKL